MVERATENTGKPERIVDLIGEIRPARRHYRGSGLFGGIRHNFRHGIGQSEDDGARRHGSDHRLSDGIPFRNSDKGVCAGESVSYQSAKFALIRDFSQHPLEMIDVFARLTNNPAAIYQDKIPYTELEKEIGDSIAGRTRPDNHQGALFYIFSYYSESVDEARENHHGRAVLIVMKNRDVEKRFQLPLYLETAGRGDIFQIDAAEHRRDILDRSHNFFRILGSEHERKRIDNSHRFEKHAFPLHHGERSF